MHKYFSLISAVNNTIFYEDTLLKSYDIHKYCEIIPKTGYDTIGKAYNAGLDEAQSEICIFTHQDVFFPPGWLLSLRNKISEIETETPNWGVIGCIGVSEDGEIKGRAYSTSLKYIGKPTNHAVEISTLDEIVIIVKKSTGLRFDECLPGFHLYGTDICMEARRLNLTPLVISLPCIHNTVPLRYLTIDFMKCYYYMRKKWWPYLPIVTPSIVIEKGYYSAIFNYMIFNLWQTYNKLQNIFHPVKRTADIRRLYDGLDLDI